MEETAALDLVRSVSVCGGCFGAALCQAGGAKYGRRAGARVLFTDAECVEVQRAPKVILAKPGAPLEEYMARQGYENQEQMGSLGAFSNGNAQELVACSQNRYFAHWVWQK